jgi:hypothetical protein
MQRQSALFLVLGLLFSLPVLAQSRFKSKEPGNVFLDNQAVRFSVGEGEGKIRVRVLDALGKVVQEKEYPEKNIALGKLPWGWYEIREGGEERGVSFAVVPNLRQKEEGWIGVDGALSWLVSEEQLSEAAEVARRVGVRWIRDRIRWGEVEQQKGRFVWGKYDKASQAQESKGLRVVQVFHDVPSWARADGDLQRFPDDLRDVFRFTREAGRHFGGRVRAWEIWNEADIPAFSKEPANEYAAFMKAAALGFREANSNLPLLQTSYALDSPRFAEILNANGTAAFYDIFNYHTYDAPNRISLHARAHAKHRTEAKAAHLPVWLTEAGIPRAVTGGSLSLEVQREQANYIAKSVVASRISGTARHFFFVLPHYLENNASYGLLNKDLTPQPGYAALAIAANILGNATYKGEIRYRQPGLHIHLFDDGTNDVLVAWTDKDEVHLPIPLTDKAKDRLNRMEIINAYGSPIPFKQTKEEPIPSLPLSPMPLYVALPRGIMVDVTANDQGEKTPKPESNRKRYEKAEVVLRLRPLEAKQSKEEEAYRISLNTAVQVEVQVYNFEGGTTQGTLQLHSESPNLKIARLSVAIDKLKGMDRQIITLPITLEKAERARMTAVFVAQNGERSSPTALDFIP